MIRSLLFVLVLSFFACQRQPTEVIKEAANTEQPAIQENETPPDLLFGELFQKVQMERVFPDGKTFVDCIPKDAPAAIMAAYKEAKDQPQFHLRAFVLEYFELPPEPATGFQSKAGRNIVDHINALWPVLTRSRRRGR